MTHASPVTSLGSEFNDFLYAPIGPDRHGMVLSVLSALARLNVDPWQEAAQLARLQVKTATERLTVLISALPDGPSARPDAATIAIRLVALLPHPVANALAPRAPAPGGGMATPTRASMVFYVILMIVLMIGQFVAMHQTKQQADRAPASSAATTAAPTLPHPAQ